MMTLFSDEYRSLFNSIFEEYMTDFNRNVQESLKAIIPDFSVFIDESLKPMGELLSIRFEHFRQLAPQLAEPLRAAGFWIPPSATLKFIAVLEVAIEEGNDSPEQIRKLIVGFYHAEDFYELQRMVNLWKDNPIISNQIDIIFDALQAHVESYYTLSIPAMLPIMETYLRQLIPGNRAIVHISEDAITNNYHDFMSEASKDLVLEYVTGISVYGGIDRSYFNVDDYPDWLQQHGTTPEQVLQRHAILHGVQVEYASVENSLRAFFILDVFINMDREDWDKKMQILYQGQNNQAGPGQVN